MAKLLEPFDPRAFELFRLRESDPEAAAKLMLLAVEYLRQRKAMPPLLADYIADAFQYAARPDLSTSRKDRAKRLTDWLNITANNRPKVKADWMDAFDVLNSEIKDKSSKHFGRYYYELESKRPAILKLKELKGIGETAANELIEEALAYLNQK